MADTEQQEMQEAASTHKDEHIEILVEEPSMETFLSAKLPEILPEGYELGVNVFIRPHNGKSDLMKSIPQKVKVFSHYHVPAKIIIIHDQDSNDCKVLKQKILHTCAEHGDCEVMVRIACRELENWYLGDMQAIEKAFPGFNATKHQGKAKFRNPDTCTGSEELGKLVKTFQKGQAARTIPLHMDLSQNRSPSLGHLVSGIQRFLGKPDQATAAQA